MKKLLIIAALGLLPFTAAAQNVGQCGWGSKLFDGQRGIAPQVLAVTTNGTSGNQTFAVTSGTSGCTQNGVVRSSWRTAAFIDSNINSLAKAAARGEGESLDTLAGLVGVSAADNAAFKTALQTNFSEIFTNEASSELVYATVKSTLENSASLSDYAVNL